MSALWLDQFPRCWQNALTEEFQKPYFAELQDFISRERIEKSVFPPVEEVFAAFRLTPLEQVRVLILGQDPYHDDGQAHGLAFSVKPGITPPASLRNIFRELHSDLGHSIPKHGHLEHWARQGVMLLNTVLTVRAHEPASHSKKGWENFTDAVIRVINARTEPTVFVLWGAHAQKKIPLIDTFRHTVIQSAHPSPLSAKHGFFGSKPFSRINAALEAMGRGSIDWALPEQTASHPVQHEAGWLPFNCSTDSQ